MRKKLQYRVVHKDPFTELTKRQMLVCLIVAASLLLFCLTGYFEDLRNTLQAVMQTDWFAFLRNGI